MKVARLLILLICMVLISEPVYAKETENADSAIWQQEHRDNGESGKQDALIITVISEDIPEVPLSDSVQMEHSVCILHDLLFAATGITGICGIAVIRKRQKRLKALQARYDSETGQHDTDR